MTSVSTRTLPLCGSGVLVPTGSVLGRRTPIRDGRFPLAVWQGRYAACDRLHDLSARHFGSRVEASHGSQMTGLFYA